MICVLLTVVKILSVRPSDSMECSQLQQRLRTPSAGGSASKNCPASIERGLFNSSLLADLSIICSAWTRHTTEALTTISATTPREGKRRGSGTAQLIKHRSRGRDREYLRLEANLYRSIDRGEFALFYQPRVDARLSAYSNRLGSWVRPGRFIPIAEETRPIHLAPCSDTSARSLQNRAAAA